VPVELSVAFQSDKALPDYIRLGTLAERYGFDLVSVYGDLMYQPPLLPLLAIALHTSRVRLGPACLNPFTLHPYEIAGQLAALDAASGGRAYLGLARGAWLDRLGIYQRRPIVAMAEAIEVVRRLLAGDASGFRGREFTLEPGVALRYPVQRPRVPLLIGTWGGQLAALAGRVADEVKVGGSANPAMVADLRSRIAAGATPAGRSADDVGVVLGAVSVVDEDGAAARRRAAAEVAVYFAVVARLDPTLTLPADLVPSVQRLLDAGDHQEAGQLIPDDVLDRFALAGTPHQVIGQVERLFAAGARRVEFGTPHGLTAERGLQLLGERVLPYFRSGA
jgi:5,10-methylenetetrahydromethanopterin reductase